METVHEVTDQGGRHDEYDLHNHRGRYVQLMDEQAADRPCPRCAGAIEKIHYLGGACYSCPNANKNGRPNRLLLLFSGPLLPTEPLV